MIVEHKMSVHRHTSILVYFFDAYGHYVDLVDICRQVPKKHVLFGTFCFFYRFLLIFVETKKNDGL